MAPAGWILRAIGETGRERNQSQHSSDVFVCQSATFPRSPLSNCPRNKVPKYRTSFPHAFSGNPAEEPGFLLSRIGVNLRLAREIQGLVFGIHPV